MLLRFFTVFFVLILTQSLWGQIIINGDFENNGATTDLINLSNVAFTSNMDNCEAFGSFGNCDIIQSATWGGGGAQNGTWYIALTGGGTDQVSMELDSPLLVGQTYSMSFWDRRDASYVSYTLDIGVSNSSTDFGDVVYTTTSAPTVNVWTERIFSFTVPFDANYITVQQSAGATGDWANVDNFQILCDVSVDLGPDINTCVGEPVILSVGVEDATYEWQDGSTDSTFTVTEAGFYSVSVQTETCSVSDVITVSFINYPNINLEDELSACVGEEILLSPSSDVLVVEYLWSTGESTQFITVDEAGIYSVEISNLGCASTDSVAVSFIDYPTVDLGEDQLLCYGESFTLSTGTSGLSYEWQDGSESPVYVVTEPGLYSVEVFNGDCSSIDEVDIEFEICDVNLELPNIFTPNGDELNNLFQPIISTNISKLTFEVYNRWGILVFETEAVDILWDGKDLNDNELSSGTYYYIVAYQNEIGDGNEMTGAITLLKD